MNRDQFDITLLFRLCRLMRSLSQHHASDAAKISFNRYWRIEHGITAPTSYELERLATVFGVPSLLTHLSDRAQEAVDGR